MTQIGPMLLLRIAAVALGSAAWNSALADEPRPVVVELFTSQSCYSCPPAEAFLGELAGRPGIVALEWHVDYWNDITYGSAGQWVDPFSNPEATRRQVGYNRTIRGTEGVYTPQMVFDGRLEAVGSRRADVESALTEASAAPAAGTVTAVWSRDETLSVEIAGAAEQPAEIWLVRFLAEHTTEVQRGENHGKLLSNHHVVTAAEQLGTWSGGAAEFTAAGPAAGEGCAILLQAEGQGAILASALCPDRPGS